ncbi:hypothetical protein PP707_01770, partial [Acetobacter pasteurianus]|nr:hypothetical protein [Acetobacter pasteurianus]
YIFRDRQTDRQIARMESGEWGVGRYHPYTFSFSFHFHLFIETQTQREISLFSFPPPAQNTFGKQTSDLQIHDFFFLFFQSLFLFLLILLFSFLTSALFT